MLAKPWREHAKDAFRIHASSKRFEHRFFADGGPDDGRRLNDCWEALYKTLGAARRVATLSRHACRALSENTPKTPSWPTPRQSDSKLPANKAS
jgi:hypothetical protein